MFLTSCSVSWGVGKQNTTSTTTTESTTREEENILNLKKGKIREMAKSNSKTVFENHAITVWDTI